MSGGYKATIQDRANAFLASLDGAGRVTVHTPNALGDWDIETFSPEAVKHVISRLENRIEELQDDIQGMHEDAAGTSI